LDDESLRNSVALWTLWFARLEKEMQQMLLMEKISATKLVLGDDMRQNNHNAPLYFIPFLTEKLQRCWEITSSQNPSTFVPKGNQK
jgi:hypothetical protein